MYITSYCRLSGKNKNEKTTVGATIDTVPAMVIITNNGIKYRSFSSQSSVW